MSARCAYCDAELRPNSMFCFECGQLVNGATPPLPKGFGEQPAAEPPGSPPPVAPSAPAAAREVPLPPVWQPAAPPALHGLPAVAEPGPPASGAPVVAVPGATPPPSSVALTFSTGERVRVSGRAVIGRKPQSTAQNAGAQAIEIHDDTRSVSRVHLTLDVDRHGVTVTDAGSGNGSSLERGGARLPLREGKPAQVHPGDRVWLGEVSVDLAFV